MSLINEKNFLTFNIAVIIMNCEFVIFQDGVSQTHT